MKKMISILTAVIFFAVSALVYGGDDSSRISAEETGEEVGDALSLCALVAVGVSALVAVGITLTVKKKKSKNEAAAIFNEATGSQSDRSNLEILAKLYDLPVEEVINTISRMTANGEIDVANALTDNDAAQVALARLNQSLESLSQSKGKNPRAKLVSFQDKLRTAFPKLFDENQKKEDLQLPSSLELANFYRTFFKETAAVSH